MLKAHNKLILAKPVHRRNFHGRHPPFPYRPKQNWNASSFQIFPFTSRRDQAQSHLTTSPHTSDTDLWSFIPPPPREQPRAQLSPEPAQRHRRCLRGSCAAPPFSGGRGAREGPGPRPAAKWRPRREASQPRCGVARPPRSVSPASRARAGAGRHLKPEPETAGTGPGASPGRGAAALSLRLGAAAASRSFLPAGAGSPRRLVPAPWGEGRAPGPEVRGTDSPRWKDTGCQVTLKTLF